jgi:hypothetical protein
MMRTARSFLAACVIAGFAGCGKDETPAKAQAYCHDLLQEGCVRAFECVPPADRSAAFTALYGSSMEGCQATPDMCANYPAACPNFDPDASSICLAEFTMSTCAQTLFIDANGDPTIGLPSSCGAVCPSTQ